MNATKKANMRIDVPKTNPTPAIALVERPEKNWPVFEAAEPVAVGAGTFAESAANMDMMATSVA